MATDRATNNRTRTYVLFISLPWSTRMHRSMKYLLMTVLFFSFVPTSMGGAWAWGQPTANQVFHTGDAISCFGNCSAAMGTTFELRVFVNGTGEYLDSGLSGSMQWSKTAQAPTGGWSTGSGGDTECKVTAIGDASPTYPNGQDRDIDII